MLLSVNADLYRSNQFILCQPSFSLLWGEFFTLLSKRVLIYLYSNLSSTCASRFLFHLSCSVVARMRHEIICLSFCRTVDEYSRTLSLFNFTRVGEERIFARLDKTYHTIVRSWSVFVTFDDYRKLRTKTLIIFSVGISMYFVSCPGFDRFTSKLVSLRNFSCICFFFRFEHWFHVIMPPYFGQLTKWMHFTNKNVAGIKMYDFK